MLLSQFVGLLSIGLQLTLHEDKLTQLGPLQFDLHCSLSFN